MNVVLILCDSVTGATGVRLLAASLNHVGHRAHVIYLPKKYARQIGGYRHQIQYPKNILNQMAELCRNAQLIGVSLMTNDFLGSIHITQELKLRGISAPIIWGGIQPTVEPEECLQYADMICIGEGEEVLVELANRVEKGQPYLDVKNLWINTPDGIRRNSLRPLIQDLDSLPIVNYTFKDEYEADYETLRPVTADLFRTTGLNRNTLKNGSIALRMLASRGCPYSCAFCCNDVYARLYPHQKRIRWRSMDHLVREIEAAQKQVGPINRIMLQDDNFAARPAAELRKDLQEYKQRVGLPFTVQLSPATVDAERLDILIEAGLDKPKMGVETANAEIAQFYHREQLFKRTQEAVALIEQNRHRFPFTPGYQFIIDNPYATLEQDLETLHFALTLKRPWDGTFFFSLMFFPGTEIYEQAMRDGLITDKLSMIYGKDFTQSPRPYLKFWVRLYGAQAPRWLLQLLLTPWLVRLMTGPVINGLLRSRWVQGLWQILTRQ